MQVRVHSHSLPAASAGPRGAEQSRVLGRLWAGFGRLYGQARSALCGLRAAPSPGPAQGQPEVPAPTRAQPGRGQAARLDYSQKTRNVLRRGGLQLWSASGH